MNTTLEESVRAIVRCELAQALLNLASGEPLFHPVYSGVMLSPHLNEKQEPQSSQGVYSIKVESVQTLQLAGRSILDKFSATFV